jgi:hypothetical protein
MVLLSSPPLSLEEPLLLPPVSLWMMTSDVPPSDGVLPLELLEHPLATTATTLTSAADADKPNNFFHDMTCLLQPKKKIDGPRSLRADCSNRAHGDWAA